MPPATLVGLCRRQAVVEAPAQLPRYANIMLTLEMETADEEAPEIYAKVIRPLDESHKRHLIHFTSVSPPACGSTCISSYAGLRSLHIEMREA
jgi:hypothetical protein